MALLCIFLQSLFEGIMSSLDTLISEHDELFSGVDFWSSHTLIISRNRWKQQGKIRTRFKNYSNKLSESPDCFMIDLSVGIGISFPPWNGKITTDDSRRNTIWLPVCLFWTKPARSKIDKISLGLRGLSIRMIMCFSGYIWGFFYVQSQHSFDVFICFFEGISIVGEMKLWNRGNKLFCFCIKTILERKIHKKMVNYPYYIHKKMNARSGCTSPDLQVPTVRTRFIPHQYLHTHRR